MSNKKSKSGSFLAKKLLKNYTRKDNVDLGPAYGYSDSTQGEYGKYNVNDAGINERSLTNKKEFIKSANKDVGVFLANNILGGVTSILFDKTISDIAGYDPKTKLGKKAIGIQSTAAPIQGGLSRIALSTFGIKANKSESPKVNNDTTDPNAITGEEEMPAGVDNPSPNVNPTIYSALGSKVNNQPIVNSTNESIVDTLGQGVDDNSMGKKEGGLMKKLNTQYRSKGGPIYGKGDAKSDSIKAKLNGGDFVVPAENSAIAENIRIKYLGGKNEPIKLNNGGGSENVMLSDGEHLFTAEEKAILESKGIDITKLAPNASENNELSGGGLVKYAEGGGRTPEQQMNYYKHQLAQARRTGNKQAELNYEREIRALSAAIELRNKAEAKGEKWSDDKTMKVQSAYFETYKKSFNERQSNKQDNTVKEEVAKPNNKVDNSYNEAVWQSTSKPGNIKSGSELAKNKQTPNPKLGSNTTTNSSTSSSGSSLAKKVSTGNASTVTTANTPASNNPNATKLQTIKPNTISVPGNNNSSFVPSATTQPVNTVQTPALLKSIASTGANNPNLPAPETKEGLNVDIGDVASAAQFGIGLAGVLKDGKRPVYETNPLLNESVNRAFTEQFSGITPADKEIYNHSLKVGLATTLENMYESGASGAAAYGNTRNAVAGYGEGLMKLASLNEGVKAQNKARFDSLLNSSLNEDKYKFEMNKMNPWLQNQEAGAALMNAGLTNFVDNQLKKNYQRMTEEYMNSTSPEGFYKKTGYKLSIGK